MDLLNSVRTAWAFTGLVPVRTLHVNAFGNLLVEDVAGRVWRLCPEELACQVVESESVDALIASEDWTMEPLVARATAELGVPGAGRCFCLKVPGALGGKYEIENVGTISLEELIAFTGDVAAQVKDLPDGTRVDIKIVD